MVHVGVFESYLEPGRAQPPVASAGVALADSA